MYYLRCYYLAARHPHCWNISMATEEWEDERSFESHKKSESLLRDFQMVFTVLVSGNGMKRIRMRWTQKHKNSSESKNCQLAAVTNFMMIPSPAVIANEMTTQLIHSEQPTLPRLVQQPRYSSLTDFLHSHPFIHRAKYRRTARKPCSSVSNVLRDVTAVKMHRLALLSLIGRWDQRFWFWLVR